MIRRPRSRAARKIVAVNKVEVGKLLECQTFLNRLFFIRSSVGETSNISETQTEAVLPGRLLPDRSSKRLEVAGATDEVEVKRPSWSRDLLKPLRLRRLVVLTGESVVVSANSATCSVNSFRLGI